MNHVEPAFQPNEIFPGCIRLTSNANECFSALSGTGHQIVARERSMWNAAGHFDRQNMEIATATKEGANDGERIAYGLHFWFAGAANSDEDFFHHRMIWPRDSSM